MLMQTSQKSPIGHNSFMIHSQTPEGRDMIPFISPMSAPKWRNHNNCFTALYPGWRRWAGTGKKHLLTHSLSLWVYYSMSLTLIVETFSTTPLQVFWTISHGCKWRKWCNQPLKYGLFLVVNESSGIFDAFWSFLCAVSVSAPYCTIGGDTSGHPCSIIWHANSVSGTTPMFVDMALTVSRCFSLDISIAKAFSVIQRQPDRNT